MKNYSLKRKMIKLSLQNLSRKIISFDVSPTTTFAEIEKMLNENENFKGSNYKFIYNTKIIDPTDSVESINYDSNSFVTVSFRPASSNKPKQSQDQSSPNQDFDEEMIEKIQVISALGYDQAEVVEALKKFDFDAEKAKNYITERLDNESNIKLADLFEANNDEALKTVLSYLDQTDKELEKKIINNPYPMLIMMGIARKGNFEDYDAFPYFYE